MSERENSGVKGRLGSILGWFLCVGILGFLVWGFDSQKGSGLKASPANSAMQAARTLASTMFQYACDHKGSYPDGRSSTEVFQKLMDGGYISDPSVFYIPMANKSRPEKGRPLEPRNVCFDVTTPVDSSSTDKLPLVFTTGYKVDYLPGGSARAVVKPYPVYWGRDRSWWDKLGFGRNEQQAVGIAVCYKGMNADFKRMSFTDSNSARAVIANFVAADFDARGRTYRQLTPDGPVKK